MKKVIITSTLACLVSFILGMSAGWHGHKSQSRAIYKLAILKGQLADSIMSNNNVYDMDGSDQMASYLYVSDRLDTLLAKQRALCQICSLRHDLCTRGKLYTQYIWTRQRGSKWPYTQYYCTRLLGAFTFSLSI